LAGDFVDVTFAGDVVFFAGDEATLAGDEATFTGDEATFTGDEATFTTGDEATFTGDALLILLGVVEDVFVGVPTGDVFVGKTTALAFFGLSSVKSKSPKPSDFRLDMANLRMKNTQWRIERALFPCVSARQITVFTYS
jgi:hypothetical protein